MLFYLLMHPLVAASMCPAGDQTHNLGMLGQHSNQRSNWPGPYSSIVLPEYRCDDYSTGSQHAPGGHSRVELEAGISLSWLHGANQMSPGMPTSSLLHEKEMELYFI